jgi:integrase
VKRLVIELSFTRFGNPIWSSIRVLERKVVKQFLRTRSVERELRHRKIARGAPPSRCKANVISRSELLTATTTIAAALAASWLKGAPRQISPQQASAIGMSAALTDPHMFGVLLYAINKYGGHGSVASALRLAPYVFVRPGELRTAEWSEIDLDKCEWLLPAQKMKMRRAPFVEGGKLIAGIGCSGAPARRMKLPAPQALAALEK